MSTTPAPMSEERLAEIEADYRLIVGSRAVVPSEIVRMADNVPALLAEVRRLRDSLDTVSRASRSTEDRLRDQGDVIARKLKAAQDLLLERARENAELLEQRDYWKARADERALRITDATQQFSALKDWAREQARSHHNLAVERKDDEELSATHNALSSAYFRLADEIDAWAKDRTPKATGPARRAAEETENGGSRS